MRRILLSLVIAGLFALAASLQASESCDTATLKASLQGQLERLDDEPVAAIMAIIDLALNALHGCAEDNYSFSGTLGAQPVLGPIPLAEGYYIMAMTTSGGGRIVGTALEGCGKDADGTLQSFTESQAMRGAENLFQIEGECTLYLELSKITAPWTLTIDKVR